MSNVLPMSLVKRVNYVVSAYTVLNEELIHTFLHHFLELGLGAQTWRRSESERRFGCSQGGHLTAGDRIKLMSTA